MSSTKLFDYVKFLTYERYKRDSDSIIGNWERFIGMLKEFSEKDGRGRKPDSEQTAFIDSTV